MSIVAPTKDPLRTQLLKFLSRPQRHRLLHGYPLAAAMPYVDRDVRRRAECGDVEFCLRPDPRSELLVGVLPHPFCNPKISGCGFCTFPHETFSAMKSAAVVRTVIQEIDDRLAEQPELSTVQIAGLYFGGGTANLTPSEPFRRLARKLSQAFDVSDAEVSLEGVPAYFVRRQPLLVDVMQEELPARHFRISMGMQTFSEKRLEQMGRLAFGRPNTFAAAVRIAHQRGMTASGDLLFNLPGQTLVEMREDVKQAIDIGLDQICLYHLVMFRGLGTAWTRDEDLLATLPGNDEASENWLNLREYLIDHGFRQTTLTNFERAELENDPRRYRYEQMSFEPDRYQMLGFGPAGISYASERDRRHAIKTMNPESSAEYMQSVNTTGPTWNRYFQYQPQDLELLHFTRRLAALQIEIDRVERLFGSGIWDRYSERFDLITDEGLLVKSHLAYSLTPRGMFFADSISGFLAQSRRQTGASRHLTAATNDNGRGFM